MARLAGTFSRLGPCKVMVIGDLILDTYTVGKAKRISPEAPVAVIQVHHEESRPGGSGNVVLNLVSLGAEVVAVGRVGNDAYGQPLVDSLRSEGVSVEGIVLQSGFKTPMKNRIIAENQQIVRVDYEQVTPISEMLEQQIIESLPKLFEGIQVIAISDYGKGFLTRTLLSEVIEAARQREIPIIADPKGIDFTKYQGVTVIKPNASETISASGLPHDAPFDLMCAKVLKQAQAEVLMVTRSEEGISLFYRDGKIQNFPVKIKEVKDVTGAGDTVLAMLTCALANGLDMAEAAQLSNVAAGIAIERFGCARVSLSDLAKRLLEFDVVNKVFDEDHLFALEEALNGKQCILLGINSDKGLTGDLFKILKRLSCHDNQALLVYLRDREPSEEFIDLLASLQEVDFIIINSENMNSLCKLILPEEVYIYEDQKLQKLTNYTLINERGLC